MGLSSESFNPKLFLILVIICVLGKRRVAKVLYHLLANCKRFKFFAFPSLPCELIVCLSTFPYLLRVLERFLGQGLCHPGNSGVKRQGNGVEARNLIALRPLATWSGTRNSTSGPRLCICKIWTWASLPSSSSPA